MKRHAQLKLLEKMPASYGGELLKTRRARQHGRPLAVRSTMHLVLRSSKAKGEKSFKKPSHERRILEIVRRFSQKYRVRIISLANVGNHLHFHIQLGYRDGYKPFIRAITSAIAMAISGRSRWNLQDDKFWDYRPFTRIVQSFRAFLNLRDYIHINVLEGQGLARPQARFLVSRTGWGSQDYYSG